MHRTLRFLVILALVIVTPIAANAVTTQQVVDQISQASYYDYMNNTLPTHLGQNRAFDMGTSYGVKVHGADHDAAAAAIYTGLRRSGWTTSYDPFTFMDDSGVAWSGNNIIAVKQGTTRPDDVYIIGAHYDSTANHESGWTTAPGGDDNGSGVAGILEMARVMSQYTFDATIVFAAFDGEEITATVNRVGVHRLGSMHYAAEHSSDNIQAMISLDMMAWNDGSNTGKLETGYSQNTALDSQIISALATYGGLAAATRSSRNYSDHVSFANDGVPALMLIENNWASNPNYHTQTDSVDMPNYIDYEYGTNMVKSITGWLCDEAGLNGVVGGPIVPEPSSVFALGSGVACVLALYRRKKII